MNSLLPIFVSPQNAANVIGGSDSATKPLGQVSKEQPPSSGQALPQAFSQILRGHETASALLKHVQALVSSQSQEGSASRLPLTEKEFRNLEIFGNPNVVKKLLGALQASRIQPSPEDSLPPITDSGAFRDTASPLSTQLLASSFAATNESIPTQSQKISNEHASLPGRVPISAQSIATPVVATNEPVPNQDQEISIEHASLPGRVPTIPLSPLQVFQPSPRTLFQDNGFPQTGGDPTLGPVRPALDIEGNFSQKAHVSLPRVLEIGTGSQQVPLPKALEAGSLLYQGSVSKVAESGLIPQEIPQGPAVKQASLELKQENVESVRTAVPSAKDVPSGFQQVGRSVLGNETRQHPILHQESSPQARPQNVQSHHIPPATAIQADGPAGFTGPSLTNQLSIKPIPGNSSLVNDVSSPVIEHRTTVPAALPGESGLLGKGERTQTLVETSMKSVGLDSSSGQGLGSGMNHFSNSQSGSQQPSLLPGQGMGVRALEERGQEFPAPALQRLQMDVQLSETQRVQIDVGVHNRQVYTGLVMDHSVLRNLATQFVPQLEQQLAEVDLELQEFSAEVREEREQEAGSLFDNSRSHKAQESGRRAQGELLSTQNPAGRQEEPGLHLVA